jgi:hypothetical protein
MADSRQYGLPKVTLLDDEYLVAVTEAELRWTEGVVAELESGELTWSLEQLQLFVEAAETGAQSRQPSTASAGKPAARGHRPGVTS